MLYVLQCANTNMIVHTFWAILETNWGELKSLVAVDAAGVGGVGKKPLI